jgi:radical SAM protein with 4Fe4S-binding SPASM domain
MISINKTLEITTTIGCPIRCEYCPQSILLKEYKKISNCFVLSYDNFVLWINKIPKEVDIHFTGFSEPWSNESCTKMLIYAHQNGHKIAVSTTGIGLKEDDIDQIKEIPFKFFYLHIIDADLFTKMTPKKQQKYLYILQKIKTNNILNKKQCAYGNVHSKIRPIFNPQPSFINTRASNLDLLKLENKFNIFNIPKISNDIDGIVLCKEMRYFHNVLLPNGDVTICCQDYGLKHIIGNISNGSYESLYHNDNFLNFISNLKNTNIDFICKHCYLGNTINKDAKFYNLFRNKILTLIP